MQFTAQTKVEECTAKLVQIERRILLITKNIKCLSNMQNDAQLVSSGSDEYYLDPNEIDEEEVYLSKANYLTKMHSAVDNIAVLLGINRTLIIRIMENQIIVSDLLEVKKKELEEVNAQSLAMLN